MKTKILEGIINLSDLKPAIEKNQILFPISIEVVNTDKYGGDARSFGYPCDEGMCTVVSYDFMVGALVEDTISLAGNIRECKKHLKKPSFEYMYERVELGDKWKQGLSTKWAEDEAKNWVKKGLIEESEMKEHIENCVDGYHSWPIEWKNAYDTAYRELNHINTSKERVVVNFGPVSIYEKDGNFYSCSEYYNNGKTSLLDTDNVDLALESLKNYNDNVKKINSMTLTFRKTLELMKENLLTENG